MRLDQIALEQQRLGLGIDYGHLDMGDAGRQRGHLGRQSAAGKVAAHPNAQSRRLAEVLEIVAAIQLRKQIDDEWWLVLAGAASILFGILLLVNPGPGALAVLWIIGFYALLFGVTLIMLSFRLRKIASVRAST